MIINWKGDGLLMVPVIEDTAPSRGGVPLVGGEVQIRILPGYNEVLDSVWFKIKPHVQDLIFDKKLDEYVSTKKADDTGELVEKGVPLRRQQVAKAREMVLNCFSIDSLVMWLKGSDDYEAEERADIRVLIDEQIKSINDGKPTRMIEEARKSLEARK